MAVATVTTIIPTHNRAGLLSRAIESALAQEVPGHEILVVDDNSSDDTQETVQRYPVRYLRVKCGKPSRTRNAGIRASQGDYLTFLDDDDIWYPDRLRPALEAFDADASVGMVYGQVQPVDSGLQPFAEPYPPLPLADGQPVMRFLETPVHMNAVAVRRSVLEAVGTFNEAVYAAEDIDLTVRLARNTQCVGIPRPLAAVCFHSTGRTDSNSAIWSRFLDETSILRHHLSVRDRHRVNFLRRQRLMMKCYGIYNYRFVQHATKVATDRAEVRAAMLSAWKASPIHAVKNRDFWRSLMSNGRP